jgi:Reductase C-terminal
LQSLGTAGPSVGGLLRRRGEGPGLTILHFAADRLVAVEAVNDPDTFAEAAALIGRGACLDRATAANGDIPLAAAVNEPGTRFHLCVGANR